MRFGDSRLPERFWEKARVNDDGCWEWLAGQNGKGYGFFELQARGTKQAHRVAYEALREPVPDGLQLDHLCRNRGCVNPCHLEVVTSQENTRRGAAATYARGAERCRRGKHRISPGNTYVRPSGRRECRKCREESAAKRLAIAEAELSTLRALRTAAEAYVEDGGEFENLAAAVEAAKEKT